MTLSDLITLVRTYVNEVAPSVGIGSDTVVTTVLNAAYDAVRARIADENPYWFAAKTTLSYTANSEFVALPAVAQTNRILKVADTTDSTTDPRELNYISAADQYQFMRQPSRWYTSGLGSITAPDFYTLSGQNILLVPRPSATRSLDIWYDSEKTALANSGDIPSDIPTRFHELLALQAARRILAFDRRSSPAFDTLASESEENLLTFVNNRATGQGSFVRVLDMDRP